MTILYLKDNDVEGTCYHIARVPAGHLLRLASMLNIATTCSDVGDMHALTDRPTAVSLGRSVQFGLAWDSIA